MKKYLFLAILFLTSNAYALKETLGGKIIQNVDVINGFNYYLNGVPFSGLTTGYITPTIIIINSTGTAVWSYLYKLTLDTTTMRAYISTVEKSSGVFVKGDWLGGNLNTSVTISSITAVNAAISNNNVNLTQKSSMTITDGWFSIAGSTFIVKEGHVFINRPALPGDASQWFPLNIHASSQHNPQVNHVHFTTDETGTTDADGVRVGHIGTPGSNSQNFEIQNTEEAGDIVFYQGGAGVPGAYVINIMPAGHTWYIQGVDVGSITTRGSINRGKDSDMGGLTINSSSTFKAKIRQTSEQTINEFYAGGNTGSYIGLELGRVSADAVFGVGGANNFTTGALPGDATLRQNCTTMYMYISHGDTYVWKSNINGVDISKPVTLASSMTTTAINLNNFDVESRFNSIQNSTNTIPSLWHLNDESISPDLDRYISAAGLWQYDTNGDMTPRNINTYDLYWRLDSNGDITPKWTETANDDTAAINLLYISSATNSQRITNLEVSSVTNVTRVINIETSSVSWTNDIINLRTSSATQNTRLNNLETSSVTWSVLFAKVTNLQTSSNTWSTDIINLRTSSTTNTGRITNLETSSITNTTRITNLETSSGTNTTRITNIENTYLRKDGTDNNASVTVGSVTTTTIWIPPTTGRLWVSNVYASGGAPTSPIQFSNPIQCDDIDMQSGHNVNFAGGGDIYYSTKLDNSYGWFASSSAAYGMIPSSITTLFNGSPDSVARSTGTELWTEIYNTRDATGTFKVHASSITELYTNAYNTRNSTGSFAVHASSITELYTNAYNTRLSTGTLLPLAGGTMTGDLNGVRANFTDGVTISSLTVKQLSAFVGDVGVKTTGVLGSLGVDSNQTYIDGNTINGEGATDTDSGEFWINYEGYNGGLTRYRNTKIGDGQGNFIAVFTGSTGSVYISSTVSAIAFVDRTEYASDKQTIWSSINSMQELSNTSKIDYSKLDLSLRKEFTEQKYNDVTKSTDTITTYGRDLTKTVSYHNEAIKDLKSLYLESEGRIADLENTIIDLKKRLDVLEGK